MHGHHPTLDINNNNKNAEDPTYLVKGQNYLKALLSGTYFQPDATDGYQSILRRTTGRWGEEEVGAVFGDYFLLEAMVSHS